MPMSHFVHSAHQLANTSGRDYLLRVWRPAQVSPSRKPATLLLLDGQWLDETIEAALGRHTPNNLQIASLGYALADRPTLAPWRAFDYTPARPGKQTQDPRTSQWPCGGAEALLAFLQEKVMAILQSEYAADPDRTAIFGHSYAGLFSLYCMAHAPTLFSHIYAASPSLWWGWPYALTHIVPAHRANPAQHWPDLDLLIGAEERVRLQAAVPGVPREPGISTIPYAQELVSTLERAGPGHAQLHILPDLAHGPMFYSAAEWVLAHCLKQAQPSMLQRRDMGP